MGKNEERQTKEKGAAAALVQRLIARALELRIVRAYLLYAEHRGAMLADSITYRALFSVFAGVLLGFSIAALWLSGNPDAMSALMDALGAVIPGIGDLVDPASIDAPVGFSLVGVVSLAGLVGAAISAIGSLRAALRVLADEFTDDAFFLWVLLRNLLVGIGFGGLLVAAAAASFLGSLGIGTVAGWFGLSESSGVAQTAVRAFGILAVFAIDALAIALVFRLLSGVRAPARTLWAGAVLGGIGLTVLQELSGLFVRGATSNPLLATFASLIALLLWFNLSAQVILIASCYIITGAAEAEDRLRARYGASTLAQRRRQRAEERLRAATDELRAAQEAEREEREGKAEQES
ncbi:YihY/virulence factor BrkB family protein [Leucobacter ruminantium]|uniref:YihY/virulence factor BrkB family protein n=1 Tax=Leucobacter ruminantium TaxID=1289170 RepID=A0A939LVS3_9MICO|nr:YihY/virulence factor BrkB family protein [Leucobacter ruminantium]MBO1805709.1 YihY/virulence factor BrkB family protein [Leucobacter ruminantium]